MELKLPVDFERLPEFRLLCENLTVGQHREALAVFTWMRVWVALAYQAQVTNQPGMLTEQAAKLLEKDLAVGHQPGIEKPIELLTACGLFTPMPDRKVFCERFARHNEHLAGNYKSKELRGAVASGLERGRKRLIQEANQQASLLPAEIFKDRAGNIIAPSDVQRLMVVIKSLDNCLKLPGRAAGAYTEGLITDAAAAVSAHTAKELHEFYVWLSLNRENPVIEKTTEQLLAKFEEMFAMHLPVGQTFRSGTRNAG